MMAIEIRSEKKCFSELSSCSICDMKQNHHFIVPESKFELVSGETELSTYRFNTKMAEHTFCSICGVQSFYTPRSNPDGRGNDFILTRPNNSHSWRLQNPSNGVSANSSFSRFRGLKLRNVRSGRCVRYIQCIGV